MRLETVPQPLNPERPPMAPHDPQDPPPQDDLGSKKVLIALGIGLRTQLLKICPLHSVIFLDEEVDPAPTFGLSLQLISERAPHLQLFVDNPHELLDLLSETFAATPCACPRCAEKVS